MGDRLHYDGSWVVSIFSNGDVSTWRRFNTTAGGTCMVVIRSFSISGINLNEFVLRTQILRSDYCKVLFVLIRNFWICIWELGARVQRYTTWRYIITQNENHYHVNLSVFLLPSVCLLFSFSFCISWLIYSGYQYCCTLYRPKHDFKFIIEYTRKLLFFIHYFFGCWNIAFFRLVQQTQEIGNKARLNLFFISS